MSRVLLLALLAGLVAGCAPQKNIPDENVAQANFYADVNAMKSRIQELRMRVEELEAKTGGKNAEVTLDEVNARLARLEETVTRMAQSLSLDVGQRRLGAPSQAAGPSAADESRDPLGTRSADADRQSPGSSYADTDRQSPDSPYADADRRSPDSPYAGDGPSSGAAAARSATSPAEGVYNMAMEAYNNRDYGRAGGLFAELLKAYPNDRQAPNTMFWQAECLFQQGDYARTALLCQDLIQKYPSNAIVASAMLKQAQAFKRLGRDQAARILLQDVVKRYPGTAEARSAQAQLGGAR